jgi:isoleucyl-tRNA synthetase
MDRWIISELNRLVREVTKSLDGYNLTAATRRIEGFVDNLSNWYVRRNRRRFWKSESDADKLAAYTALYECLVVLCQLLAPFVPFVAEELYQNLCRSVDPKARESVHLSDFPAADEARIDDRLNSDVELAMRISSLGRAARAKSKEVLGLWSPIERKAESEKNLWGSREPISQHLSKGGPPEGNYRRGPSLPS